MSIDSAKVAKCIEDLNLSGEHAVDLLNKIRQKGKKAGKAGTAFPCCESYTAAGQQARIKAISDHTGLELSSLNGMTRFNELESLKGNIENYIGMAQIPIGLIGPVKVNGISAQGEFFVPLATTEGALVASYNRGVKATGLSGGITSICLMESVQRSPVFTFDNLIQSGRFVCWVMEHLEVFKVITNQTSRYAKWNDLKTNMEGNHVTLTFEFTTGDAAGQNMVTFCTQAICEYILAQCPVTPLKWFIESNYSGDKKATARSFTAVRGKKVIAETVIPAQIVKDILRSTPEKMVDYSKISTLAAVQSGSIGAQGHIANALAALFIACGQDAACVSEASVGITRFDLTRKKDLYVSVTLSNLIVGTVGGGTHLPTQKECLQIMGCYGEGNSKKFAEICTAVVLAGEISLVAAISAGHFVDAHKYFGRKKPLTGNL